MSIDLNENHCHNSDCLKKIRELETCVEELNDQNSGFVEAVLELENEVKNRVCGMEELLSRTADSAKAYMVKLSEYQDIVSKALHEKNKLLKHIRNLSEKIILTEEEKNNLQDQNNNLTHDISSFIKLVNHARNTGHWDVGNIDFCDVTFEQVFGSIDQLSHWSDEDKCKTPNSLPDHFSTDYNQLKKNSTDRLTTSVYLHASCNFNNFGKNNIWKLNSHNIQLQSELNRTRNLLTANENQLAERDRIIAELQVQITDLSHDISRREADCFVHTQFNGRHHISSIESLNMPDSVKSEPHLMDSAHLKSFERDCDCCESRLKVIEKLRNENELLLKECKENQSNLDKCCEDIEVALHTNSKLEQEISIMEKLWQELEAVKEENEVLLKKLEKKCHKEKETEKILRANKISDVKQLNDKLLNLMETEEIHRMKAEELEFEMNQLRKELDDQNKNENIYAELEELKKSKIEQEIQFEELLSKLEQIEKKSDDAQMKETEDKQDLKNELQISFNVVKSKNEEIDHLKLTIHNLQEALVELKRNPGINVNPVVPVNDKTQRNIPIQKPSMQKNASVGDVFDI